MTGVAVSPAGVAVRRTAGMRFTSSPAREVEEGASYAYNITVAGYEHVRFGSTPTLTVAEGAAYTYNITTEV